MVLWASRSGFVSPDCWTGQHPCWAATLLGLLVCVLACAASGAGQVDPQGFSHASTARKQPQYPEQPQPVLGTWTQVQRARRCLRRAEGLCAEWQLEPHEVQQRFATDFRGQAAGETNWENQNKVIIPHTSNVQLNMKVNPKVWPC